MAELPPQSVSELPSVALRDADTHRSRRGYIGAAILCFFGAIALHLVEGLLLLRWLASGTIMLAGLVCGAMAWRRRDGSPFTDAEASIMGLAMCLAALMGIAHTGPLVVITTVLVFLVIGIAMGNEARGRLFFLAITIGYGVIGVLAVVAIIPAVPLVALRSPLSRVVGVLLVELVLVMAYWFGVGARRSTTSALEFVQRAKIEIAGRDALLQEAHADLERLARGGAAGRLSGTITEGFRIGDVLGRGAMGEVYRAVREDDSVVALKVLDANLIADESLVDRFFREAKVCRSLDSKHVVKVLGFGMMGDGSPYLAMELLGGSTLSEILRERGTLRLAATAQLVGEVANGLEAAHATGVVHRDIKPGNLMLLDEPKPHWKILDFGISKLLGSGTLTGADMIGTPGYMPPEQVEGRDVDERADVFALGAVAYRAVTGVPPFSGPDVVAVLLNAVRSQPVRPSAIVDMPEDVELVLAIALAKDRSKRFESVAELAKAFADARKSRLAAQLREAARELIADAPWANVNRAAPRDAGPEGATRVS